MSRMRAAALGLALAFLIVSCVRNGRGSLAVESPDGKNRFTLTVASGVLPGSGPRYTIHRGDRLVIADSPLNLWFKGAQPLAGPWLIVNEKRHFVNEAWTPLWGKQSVISDHYNEMSIGLLDGSGRQIGLEVRAYDDGVAFRYVLPQESRLGDFELCSENTRFVFPSDQTVWAANLQTFKTSQEKEYLQSRLSDLSPEGIYGLPLLVRVDDGLWLAVTEADLDDWAGMYLVRDPNQANTLKVQLAPHPDNPEVAVRSRTPRHSPWRVLMLGPSPGALIESNLILNLSEPSEIQDTSWIRPGRSAWDWWWCGRYAPDLDFELGSDNRSYVYFIDFAAEMGWEYQLVDWHWYGDPFEDLSAQIPNPQSDITVQNPKIDIPYLVDYAGSKGVGIWLWLHWWHLDRQIEEAFALYQKWGVKGVKIDFMDRDDQEMVNFYERVCRNAAEHQLLVDFHGAYKPTGLRRTWPNLLTREGVLGNEYNKWSSRITLEHCLTVPFTRMLAGPMDFTPGGFRHTGIGEFQVVGGDAPAPLVRGTRAFQLAMSVVYESALQVYCDSPYAYRNSPAGLDWLKGVPSTWDETRALFGEVGEYICIGRRSGDTWFIGAMTDENPRTLKIPLDFLDTGAYAATTWEDGPGVDSKPADLQTKRVSVNAGDTLEARMAPGGGFCARLQPARD